MSEDDQDSADKEHEPSAKKLEDARKQGDVARSNDLVTAAAATGFLIAAAIGTPLLLQAATAGKLLFDTAPQPNAFAKGGAGAMAKGFLLTGVAPVLGLFLLPAALALAALVGQKALIFAPSKLKPKLSRVSPVASAHQKFGLEGLMEFAKNFVKSGLVGLTLVYLLRFHTKEITTSSALGIGPGIDYLLDLLFQFFSILIGITIATGVVDYFWQRHALHRRNRMSRKELLDETKDAEGDPQSKAARRQRGQDIAMNQMLSDIPTASVVIVNPTHFAVALRWRPGDRSAPVVVAKGVDEIALRIRQAAKQHNVPIHFDPPTARAIHATIRIGEPINREHYKAVAAAIRFSDSIKKRNGSANP